MKTLLAAAVCFFGICAIGFAEEEPWRKLLTPDRVGNAVPLRPFNATFVFGWSNVPAGEAKVSLRFPTGDRFAVEAEGSSAGLARRLWQLDATYEVEGNARNFVASSFQQREFYRRHRIELDAVFQNGGAKRLRQREPSPDRNKWREYAVEGMRDLAGTMLYIRSQPLRNGDRIVTLCFPGDNPYLVEIEVLGREKLEVAGEEVDSIKLALDLQRIETRGEDKGKLFPHRRFRSGTIWLADNDWRLPLRAEVRIFFGYVYGELESWEPG